MNHKLICDKLNEAIVVNEVANPQNYHMVGPSNLFRLVRTKENDKEYPRHLRKLSKSIMQLKIILIC